jgi:hypothetical protein
MKFSGGNTQIAYSAQLATFALLTLMYCEATTLIVTGHSSLLKGGTSNPSQREPVSERYYILGLKLVPP